MNLVTQIHQMSKLGNPRSSFPLRVLSFQTVRRLFCGAVSTEKDFDTEKIYKQEFGFLLFPLFLFFAIFPSSLTCFSLSCFLSFLSWSFICCIIWGENRIIFAMEEYMLWLYDVQGPILTQQRASDWKMVFVNSVTVFRFLQKRQQFFDKLRVYQLLKNLSLNKLIQTVIILIYISERLQFRNLLGTRAKLSLSSRTSAPSRKCRCVNLNQI